MSGLPRIGPRIAGRDVFAGATMLPVIDPATERPLAELDEAGPAEVDRAVGEARRSFDSGVWSRAERSARRAVLRRIAESVRASAAELAALQIAETGLPQSSARNQIAAGAAWFDYYADFLATEGGEAFDHVPGATAIVARVPIGVCALFSPWNVPVGLAAIKLAPALAAGNSVIAKPSEAAPMVARRFFEIVEAAGVPSGVLNVVNGRGETTGAALAGHAGVDMISFTGGAAGGRAVGIAAARRHIPCVMELGGKSATLVFDDCDFDKAVAGAARAVYANNGEACLAGTRILVQEGIAERFLAAFETRARAMRVGDPADPEVELGPMISAAHRDKVLGYCAAARGDGDDIRFGGQAPPDRPAGFFVAATAVVVRNPRSRVWREEIFGPVASFMIFRDEAEAVALANDSEFGLAGYVWSENLGRAMRAARSLRTGTVVINQSFLREPNAPFGGFKASGVGREGGAHSWANFTQAKTTVVNHG
jgi:5-carboxymethyl-2-hydroxymuconic-semialdehyde dehydrogenase/aminomuconate-semialdehyde/2-hydroxymuconate-6-semialdehyde dehydrogenase